MSPVNPFVSLLRTRGPVNLGGGGSFRRKIWKSAVATARKP
jgi:hypothetical protein